MAAVKKIVLIGHFGVGKTSLVRRYVDSAFNEDYLVTVGVHVKKKEVTIDEEIVTLIIWDIEGNNSIDKARSSYLLGTHGFIYVFDVMRPETYEDIQSEMDYLEDNYKDIPVCMVGNKSDLFTEEFNQDFFNDQVFKNCYFTSAKTGDKVEDLFIELAKRTL
ncbi:GTP-binding protein [Aureitalea sp. L0-47]|uniref:Rab family GTPase n=1 Tax=Aureitalea sp. L0-47 TaxID=2816962 RepID=UPI002238C53C|nr:Rab family GTPase [Aureitalea sp. L0-47]MCW5519026.1 GTP-binding protein [Aureitalea sp. L0-47]